MKTATLMSNTLTIEGDTKEHNVSLTYTNYKGNSIVDKLNDELKHTFNINLVNKFAKWFELSSRLTYIDDNVKNRQYTNANNRNPVNTYVHMARSTSLEELKHYKDESGKETPPIGPTL